MPRPSLHAALVHPEIRVGAGAAGRSPDLATVVAVGRCDVLRRWRGR